MDRGRRAGRHDRPDPVLQHHRQPHHLAVIPRVIRQPRVHQFGGEGFAQQPARAERGQRIAGEIVEPGVLQQPQAEGQAKAVFLLAQNGLGQKIAQRVFEKHPQFPAAHLERGRQMQ